MTRFTVLLLWDVIERAGEDAFRRGRMLVALALYLEARTDMLGRIEYPWVTYYDLSREQDRERRQTVKRAWEEVFGRGRFSYGDGPWPAQQLARTTDGLPRTDEEYGEVYAAACRARRLCRARSLTPAESVDTAIRLSEEQTEAVYGRPVEVAPYLSEMRAIAEWSEEQAPAMTPEERKDLPAWECGWRHIAVMTRLQHLPEDDRLREGARKMSGAFRERIEVLRFDDDDDAASQRVAASKET